MEDEWIEWGGGDCPVDGEDVVCIKLRDDVFGGSLDDEEVLASELDWHHGHGSPDDDIIAYRLSKKGGE